MNLLSFPDLNVWRALASPDHEHHATAALWWEQQDGMICFTRFTQLGFLRLATTAAAMDGKPYTMARAWEAYDRFYEDERVRFHPDPAEAEARFRRMASDNTVSPKLWMDAWLLSSADAAGGVLVTFDKALASRGAHCLLSKR
ncbi:TA system VapC family ribonuclease toxin [Acidicapsa dinghuensis]|uniref:Ribonuclease VapC n=1 Tax=Acidicapsa dinghuensis TaxID=2218256 RepID=A0ABW1EEN4_9BACT|nr:TA system VapC family ribonuclease toxin [Acidicapsa dinghuensis]